MQIEANDVVALHLNLKAGLFKVTVRGLTLFQGIVARPDGRARGKLYTVTVSLVGNAGGTILGSLYSEKAFCALNT